MNAAHPYSLSVRGHPVRCQHPLRRLTLPIYPPLGAPPSYLDGIDNQWHHLADERPEVDVAYLRQGTQRRKHSLQRGGSKKEQESRITAAHTVRLGSAPAGGSQPAAGRCLPKSARVTSIRQ